MVHEKQSTTYIIIYPLTNNNCNSVLLCSNFSNHFPVFCVNPIRSGLFQTVKSTPPPPYDLENYCVNLHHIIHVNFTRCFRHDPIGIFQKFAILTILQRFQNKK